MANPKFKGYTPAQYAQSSVNLGMFAPALAQMQERYDLASQTLDEAAFDFSSLAPDNPRAQEISKEFEAFKSTLAEDLLKTKDYRNAAKELRRLNKIYNEDPEIALYRQRKEQFLADREVMRKKVEKDEVSESAFKLWEQRVLGQYAEQGGAGYNRATGSFNSFDSSPRNIDREKELMEKVEELAHKAPNWAEAADAVSGWTFIDPTTRERIKTTIKKEYKNRDQMRSEIYNHLAQSDYFKDSLKDNARDRYYAESRAVDPENKGLAFAEETIINYVNSLEGDLAIQRNRLATATTAEDKEIIQKEIDKLNDAKTNYINKYQEYSLSGDQEAIRKLGEATYEADYITGKILGFSTTGADIFDYMRTEQGITPYTDALGGGSGTGGSITSEDLKNSTVNVVESGVGATADDPFKAIGYSVGEVNSQFVEENFNGKDFYAYTFGGEVAKDWLNEVENFDEIPNGKERIKRYELFKQKDFKNLTPEQKLEIEVQEKNAKNFHRINQYNVTYNNAIKKEEEKAQVLNLQLKDATGAEAERIKAEIVNINKEVFKLKSAKESTFAGPNAYLRDAVNKLKEGDIDYDENLKKYVEEGNFDAAWKYADLEAKRRLVLSPVVATDDPYQLSPTIYDFGTQITDFGEQQLLINKTRTPLLPELTKKMAGIAADQASTGVRGIAIDDKAKVWTNGHLQQLAEYFQQNINHEKSDTVKVVRSIEKNDLELITPEDDNYPKFDIKNYGTPNLYKTITRPDGSEYTILQYNNKNYSDVSLAKAYYEARGEDTPWKNLTAEQKASYIKTWQKDNPQTLYLATNSTSHFANAINSAETKYASNMTKGLSALVIAEQSNFPNPEAEEFIGNTIHTFAAIALTNGEIQDEYKEAEAAIFKIEKEGDRNKGARMILQHQPAAFHTNADGTYTGFQTTYRYVPEVGNVQAQIARITLDKEGKPVGQPEPYQTVDLNITHGGYAQSIMALDLLWGTGNPNYLPSYGDSKYIPAFTNMEITKRLSAN